MPIYKISIFRSVQSSKHFSIVIDRDVHSVRVGGGGGEGLKRVTGHKLKKALSGADFVIIACIFIGHA